MQKGRGSKQKRAWCVCLLYVTPNLQHASSIFNPSEKNTKRPIEAVQSRAIRFMTRDYSRSSSVLSTNMSSSNILSLSLRKALFRLFLHNLSNLSTWARTFRFNSLDIFFRFHNSREIARLAHLYSTVHRYSTLEKTPKTETTILSRQHRHHHGQPQHSETRLFRSFCHPRSSPKDRLGPEGIWLK